MKRGIFVLLCFLTLLCTLLAGCRLTDKGAVPSEKLPIIILLLDTTRADHLGVYGYERDTSPNLDAFARENTFAKYAMTAAPWTPPSVASILSGLYPRSHGMMPPNSRSEARKATSRLNPNVETLPEILRRHGYRTAGVTPNPWITEAFGFKQGFDHFIAQMRDRAEGIVATGKKLIDEFQQSNDPFFLYLHFLDPHDPWDPPGEFKEMFSGPLKERKQPYSERMIDIIGRYDGEIRYLDTELGKFFQYLKEKGIYDKSYIFIVADHGEQFMEHGRLRHGYFLHGEEIHIPLMFRTPRSADRGRVIESVVSTIDIFPTVHELVGVPIAPSYQGVSLLNEAKLRERAGVYSQVRRVFDQRGITRQDGKKLILEVPLEKDMEPEKIEALWTQPKVSGVYDTRTDVFEHSPIKDEALQSDLRRVFDDTHDQAGKNRVDLDGGAVPEVTEEQLEELKSLGYLQ